VIILPRTAPGRECSRSRFGSYPFEKRRLRRLLPPTPPGRPLGYGLDLFLGFTPKLHFFDRIDFFWSNWSKFIFHAPQTFYSEVKKKIPLIQVKREEVKNQLYSKIFRKVEKCGVLESFEVSRCSVRDFVVIRAVEYGLWSRSGSSDGWRPRCSVRDSVVIRARFVDVFASVYGFGELCPARFFSICCVSYNAQRFHYLRRI